MHNYQYFISGILALILFGCTNVSVIDTLKIQPQKNVYADELFANYRQIVIESEEEVFSIDEPMKKMIHEDIKGISNIKKRTIALIDKIFAADGVNLHYANGANLTAKQTFYSGSANCISLTILAFELAKEAGLVVKYQKVDVPEFWQRNGKYNMLTGHVNLSVKNHKNYPFNILNSNKMLTIDFDSFVAKERFKAKVISQQTMLAIFYNNKGAHALANNEYGSAYQYLKAATLVDSTFSAAWANLGILYKLNHAYLPAEKAYLQAIYVDSENITAIGNLAILLRFQEKIMQAKSLEQYVKNKRSDNPYYYSMLAEEYVYKKDYNEAITQYKKAISLAPAHHEFHIELSKVYMRLGQYEQAQIWVKKAITVNKNTMIDQEYSAKLTMINQKARLFE